MQSLKPQKTLVEQTYDILVDAIAVGTLAPGERLTQDSIAARLNVSRQPVNSALQMLQANQLVEATGRRGVIVSPMNPALLRDIYEVRSALEPLAVDLAGQRPMTADEEAEGAEIVAAGWQAQQGGDTLNMVRADVAFHSYIYRLSGNGVIESTMRVYWHHIRRAMTQILSGDGFPETVWRQHEAIYAGLRDRNPAAAVRVMQDHLAMGYGRIAGKPLKAPGNP